MCGNEQPIGHTDEQRKTKSEQRIAQRQAKTRHNEHNNGNEPVEIVHQIKHQKKHIPGVTRNRFGAHIVIHAHHIALHHELHQHLCHRKTHHKRDNIIHAIGMME